jgi:hypothetical protein
LSIDVGARGFESFDLCDVIGFNCMAKRHR